MRRLVFGSRVAGTHVQWRPLCEELAVLSFTAIHTPAAEGTLETLLLPFAEDLLRWPTDARVLFLRARDGFALREVAQPEWLCEQSFKPFADALSGSRMQVADATRDMRFATVLVLPPRQRDEARACFARAARHADKGGTVVACVANAEGAKSAEADLQQLLGPVAHLSKHKCRVFWGAAHTANFNAALCEEWLALDTPRINAAGYISRPGLFAWDRVDPASALLAQCLPADLHGQVADLGAGYGYLATELIARCPQVTAIDLYEAEARALEPARLNIDAAMRDHRHKLDVALHWHDVTAGLPPKCYDAIVSNPPFHQGRADQPELGRAFIAQAAQALRKHGQLWLVANRHLPYEATLSAHFQQMHTVATQDGFKVIHAGDIRE